ncbi:hypothetical protein [Kitasatospora paranensis]|uniref:FXSXX-COOH protein n=1 Tax=Kitasatospora paranensis TaxID=258053 RepID=A0ABW2FRR9_9ACTN
MVTEAEHTRMTLRGVRATRVATSASTLLGTPAVQEIPNPGGAILLDCAVFAG